MNINLSFSKSKNMLSLNFPFQDFGMQHFLFAPNHFFIAYNFDKKNIKKTLSSFYQNVPDVLDQVVINPSIVNKVINHKGKFHLPLKQKTSSFKPRGVHVKLPKTSSPQDEINQIVYNLNVAVKKAATSQDLSHFARFNELFNDLLVALGKKAPNSKISKKQENDSFKIFRKKVETLQKKLYNIQEV